MNTEDHTQVTPYKAKQENKFHRVRVQPGKETMFTGKGGGTGTQRAWGGVLAIFLTGCGYVSVQLLICFLNHSYMFYEFFLVIISSVTQSCPTLRDTMDCSTAVLPVHHQLPELTQAHVHWVGDAIQPSLSSPSPPAFHLSQHQGLCQFFATGGLSTGVIASASELPMNIQDWSSLGWTGCISLQSKGLSRVFSNTTVQKHQFFSAELSL